MSSVQSLRWRVLSLRFQRLPRFERIFCEVEGHLPARILNGNAIRDQIYAELSGEIAALAARRRPAGPCGGARGRQSGLQLYVNSKIAACEKLGLASFHITPPATITTEEMLALVDELNARDDVDGILVQLPLPAQVDTKRILEAVDPAKDVDGFHPMNVGQLVAGRPGLVACTPAGVMEILRRSGIAIEGANAVVMGRSDIVGKPMALLLMHANATVTICHSKTRDLPEVVRRADIVVAAIGRAAMVERRIGAAGRDGDRRRAEPSSQMPRKPDASSRIFRRSWSNFARKDRCWWATCIRTSRKLPERSRRCRAAWAR